MRLIFVVNGWKPNGNRVLSAQQWLHWHLKIITNYSLFERKFAQRCHCFSRCVEWNRSVWLAFVSLLFECTNIIRKYCQSNCISMVLLPMKIVFSRYILIKFNNYSSISDAGFGNYSTKQTSFHRTKAGNWQWSARCNTCMFAIYQLCCNFLFVMERVFLVGSFCARHRLPNVKMKSTAAQANLPKQFKRPSH